MSDLNDSLRADKVMAIGRFAKWPRRLYSTEKIVYIGEVIGNYWIKALNAFAENL
jgi:hypothetical protein